jgi:hypothetical protein
LKGISFQYRRRVLITDKQLIALTFSSKIQKPPESSEFGLELGNTISALKRANKELYHIN